MKSDEELKRSIQKNLGVNMGMSSDQEHTPDPDQELAVYEEGKRDDEQERQAKTGRQTPYSELVPSAIKYCLDTLDKKYEPNSSVVSSAMSELVALRQTLYLWPVHHEHPPCNLRYFELSTPDGQIVQIPSRIDSVVTIEAILKVLGLDIDVKVHLRNPTLEYKEKKVAKLQKEIAELQRDITEAQKELDKVEKLEVE